MYMCCACSWHDPAGQAQSRRALVNDLNLVVTDPNGATLLGNGETGTSDTIKYVNQYQYKGFALL